MPKFLYQVETTNPGGWAVIEAENHRMAAVMIASKFPPGRVRVNVASNDPGNLYENGSPKMSRHFILDVEKEKDK
jgi:hypothetical protein